MVILLQVQFFLLIKEVAFAPEKDNYRKPHIAKCQQQLACHFE